MKIIEKIKNIFHTLLNKLKENKVVQKIMYFLNKDNFTKTKLVLVALASLAFATICEYTIFRIWYPQFISKNRIILVSIIYMFIGIHFVFKLSKMYEFIHKNRYKIACAFLLFVMLFKYSGSSITHFHAFASIQPHHDDTRYHTLLGTARTIRTDEWATSTPYILSQANSNSPFSYFGNVLRGTETEMFTVAKAPVLDILMLGRPFQIGFLLFGNDAGLSFYWYARLVAMMLGAYELCLILTNKNKRLSLCGMLVITFSAAVQWWYCMHVLIYGQIVVVLLDKFMLTDKKRNKYLCALGILIAGLSYIFELYPAWQVSFGYLFLALVIYILIKNIKYEKYKINLHDIIVVLITIVCIALLLGRWYTLSKDAISATMNTDYPGDRQEIGGGAINNYSYFYNIFFTFEEYPLNPCEYASMLSLFPIPMILGLIYVIRNKKDLHFWIPMLTVSGFLAIWCVYGFPAWLANLSLMSMTTAGRVSVPLGTACIYILIYLIGSIKEDDKFLNKWVSFAFAVIATIYVAYKAKSTIAVGTDGYQYLIRSKILIGCAVFFAVFIGVMNIQNEKAKRYTMYALMVVALITGLRVNPIIRTTDIFYTKPVAVKMKEIKDQNPEAIWVVVGENWYLNDYALANGIRTLNSTNIYPNIKMYETILGDKAKEQREIYNRYAHVNCKIINEESNIELLFADNISINLNYNDLEKLDIQYILSKDIDINSDEYGLDVDFEKIYEEDGMYIFKVTKGN